MLNSVTNKFVTNYSDICYLKTIVTPQQRLEFASSISGDLGYTAYMTGVSDIRFKLDKISIYAVGMDKPKQVINFVYTSASNKRLKLTNVNIGYSSSPVEKYTLGYSLSIRLPSDRSSLTDH